MKKILITSTLSASLLFQITAAETLLYGSIRFDYRNSKDGIGSNLRDNLKQRTSNLNDLSSRIGLKGGEDLGNGVQLIFHLEWRFNGMEGGNNGDGFRNRLAYLGLVTDMGTVVAGRIKNPFKETIVDHSVIDDFNSFGHSAAMRAVTSQFAGGIGVDYGTFELASTDHWDSSGWGFNSMLGDYPNHNFGLDRVSNAIAYLSPSWNGFSFNGALIMDDDSQTLYSHKRHLDLFTLNALYMSEMGFYGKIGYIQGNTIGNQGYAFSKTFTTLRGESRKTRAYAMQLGYRTDQFGFSASYADAKLSNAHYSSNQALGAIAAGELHGLRKDKAKGWDIGASYSFGDHYASTIRLAYGETRYTSEDHASGVERSAERAVAQYHNTIKPKDKIWAVGFEQKLSDRTRVWSEYQNVKQSGESRRSNQSSAQNGHHQSEFNNQNDTFAVGIRHDF